MSPQLYKNLKLAESPGGRPVLKAYQDTKNIWTIGHGRNLQTMTIPESLAEQWFAEDVATAAKHAEKFPEWQYLDTEARQDALIELVFNMGPGRVQGFKKMLEAIRRQDWEEAAAELLDSKWRTDVGPTRSNRIAKQLETGRYL